jgi:hypothetical protein
LARFRRRYRTWRQHIALTLSLCERCDDDTVCGGGTECVPHVTLVFPPALASHCGNPTTCAVSGCPFAGGILTMMRFLATVLRFPSRPLGMPRLSARLATKFASRSAKLVGQGEDSPVTTNASVCGQKKTRRAKHAGNTLTAFASAATPGPALGLEAPTIVFSATLVPNIPRLASHAAGAVPLAARLQPTADVAYARQVCVV